MMSRPATVQPLLPAELGQGRVRHARGVRAGDWVFASGCLATSPGGRFAPDLVDARLPLFGEPRHRREAEFLLARAGEVLAAGGAGFDRLVRLDQFYDDWRAVDHYQQARRATFGSYVPPSTSILVPELLVPGASMDVSMIALANGARARFEALAPAELEVPAGAGFSPVVIAGDHVFIAGFMAAWKPGDLGGIAPEAQVPPGHLWKGTRIQRESEYLIAKKLLPALAAAGASPASTVKAQIYLADISDLPAFNAVWQRHFGAAPVATLIVPTARPGFAIADAQIEINLVALREEAIGARTVIEAPRFVGMAGQPAAVRAGDLLLVSGLMAVDANGAAPGVRADTSAPYFGSGGEAQMEHILDTAEEICARAGTSLENVVRVQQFHTDLREFYPTWQVWQRRLPDRDLPFSALRVPGPLAVPACTIMLDLWIYAPAGMPA
jgi:enamine deaminase RidA (YjgF/YER057c/UK114 family)